MSAARDPSEAPLPMAVPRTESVPGVEAPRRGPTYGSRLAIAADHPTASLAGMNVLQSGGSAVDAAIATAAVNVVLKPHRTQLGGDAFALIWHRKDGTVECLNAGGRASRHATPERFANGIPSRGPLACTVPGIVDSWAELHARHASRSLTDLLEPAVRLATDGFPVSLRLAGAMELLARRATADDAELKALFLADGERPYREGELFRQPALAETLEDIAQEGREGFYAGRTGKAITEAMAASGGLIDEEDLAEPAAGWHEPLTTSYKGCTMYEQALPSQGIVLLEALNIVEQLPLADWGLTSADAAHTMVEATRLAFADVRRYAADPLVERVPVEQLLSKEHARARAAEIDPTRAKEHGPGPLATDTTSFVVADEETVVSYIQSVYQPWGSRFVVPGTGVLMNNRMLGFHADPDSPNRVAPRKRAVHTLNTFLVVRDGQLVVGGGTPGGDFQVQTNLQTIVGVLDWGLDLQSAIDSPLWAGLADGRLAMENRFPPELVAELVRRGPAWDATLARSQVIASRPEGGWAVVSDSRGTGVSLAV